MKFRINCVFSETEFDLGNINIFTPKSNVDFNLPRCLSGSVLYQYHYPIACDSSCSGFYGLIKNDILLVPSGICDFSHATGVVAYTGYVNNAFAANFYSKSGSLFNIKMYGLEGQVNDVDQSTFYSTACKVQSFPNYAIQSKMLMSCSLTYFDSFNFYGKDYWWHRDTENGASSKNCINLIFDKSTEQWKSSQFLGSYYYQDISGVRSTMTGRSVMIEDTMCSGTSFGFDFSIKPSKEYVYDKCNGIFYKIYPENIAITNITGAVGVKHTKGGILDTKDYKTGIPCVEVLFSNLQWNSFIGDQRPNFVSHKICSTKITGQYENGIPYTEFQFCDDRVGLDDVNEFSTFAFNLKKNYCEDRIFKITSITENYPNEYNVNAMQFCTGKFLEIEESYTNYLSCHDTLNFNLAYANATPTTFQLKSPLLYDLGYIKNSIQSDCIQFSWNTIECAKCYNIYIERPSNTSEYLITSVTQGDSKYYYNNKYYYQIEIPAASKQAGTYSVAIEAVSDSAATSLRTCKCISTLDY